MYTATTVTIALGTIYSIALFVRNETKKNKFTPEEQSDYVAIFERIFNTKVSCTPCSFAKTVWADLMKVYNQYL